MSDFKNSQTALNLMKAFAGESQARTRYTYYAGVAKKQGFLQIANIFMETAENEKEHAKVFYKKLLEYGMNEEVIILNDAGYPVALSEDTFKNLEYAANGEQEEWTELYPAFADMADKEGYKDVATAFRLIAKVEEKHEYRYRKLAKNVKEHEVFKKDGKVFWKCLNCGYITENIEAPEKCPACQHPQSYFEIHIENY
ncbi:MAG TPA: rubrerythrin family protein [Candidatus Cloacimonadota bacterium]|jgi:rubrerythrin|nr:rubrerythrin family protein [Candidatus Cloacimonadota bacterium]HPM01740.1 rubrerythrin family protein [Candidatus Cloacimonadota bacterium]